MTIEAIEIKNRLSSIGEAIGMIALEYIEKLEKENQQLKKENKIMEDIIIEQQEENEQLKEQIEKMKCCENCKHQNRLAGESKWWEHCAPCKADSEWELEEYL